jgi:hypothetical protein
LDVPSTLPAPSSARTSTTGAVGAVIVVSKPAFAVLDTDAKRDALAPLNSSQDVTWVAPFQLTLTVVVVPAVCATTAGEVLG